MQEPGGRGARLVAVGEPWLTQMTDAQRGGADVLGARAARQYHVATSRLSWARDHHRLVALVDADDTLLATAERLALTGHFDGTPVRLCSIGAVTEYTDDPAPAGPALVQRLVDEAREAGDDLALISGEARLVSTVDVQPVPTTDLTLVVTESTRRGAPMAPVRSGERGDLAVIATMPALERPSCRLRLDRGADYLDFRVTRARLRAGLDEAGARELLYLVVEEGTRAAAYVVISVSREGWSLEVCGDHDPTGARVGALLQAIIARQPAEQRPTLTGWLPPGFRPPQVEIVSTQPSDTRLWMTALSPGTVVSPLTADDVALWRCDRP